MKKVLIALLVALTLGLAMLFIAPTRARADFSAPAGNLVTNWDFEETIDPAWANGATLAHTTDQHYNGSGAMAVTGRTTGTWNAYNYDVTTIQLGQKYEYAFYAMTPKEGGSDIQAGYSPWAKSGEATGSAYLWYYGAGSWMHINQNEWTRVSAQFELRVVTGKLYVVTVDAEGDESFALAKDFNGTAEDFDHLDLIRLSLAASVDADLYIDCITLAPVVENTETPVEYTAPTGNLVTNWNFEETIDPAYANGATLAHTTEKHYYGSGSMALTGRTTGTWNAFNYDVATIQLGQKYEYAFYAMTTKEGGADIQAGYSPWAQSATPNWLWYYGAGSWMHINQNEWTRVSAQFELRLVEGKLYVVTLDAEGDESFALAKDYNGTDELYDHLEFIRLSLSASVDADLYIDCLTLAPVESSNPGTDPATPQQPANYEVPAGNLVTNWDLEENLSPASALASTMTHSTDYAAHGTHSMLLTGRNEGVYSAFNLDVTTIQLGQKYEYAFYAMTTKEGGTDILASYSPWAQSATPNWLWYYGAGSWMHINQNEWTRVSAQFELRVVEGKLYVVTLDAEGDESFALAKDYNGTDELFDHLDLIRLSLNASVGADLYIDCITLAPATSTDTGTNPDTPDTPDTPEVPQPTGHAGGDDASLTPGNMVQNATFDTKMFSKELTNSGVWYVSSPERVEIYDDYSQDGTDSGSCAHVYDRYGATSTFMFRSLNIWVKNMYTLTGYVSSREATKGAIIVRMWAYYDEYTDENPVQRYPYAEYALPLKELKPGEWTKFEVTFGWKYDDETGILSMQIYDWDSKEVIAEVETTRCTGLSSYEFRFTTDPTDENYLTDLYFDNYTMLKVTEHFVEETQTPEDPGDDPVIVPPTTQAPTTQAPTTQAPKTQTEPSETGKKKGCKNALVPSILGVAFLLGSIVVIRRKREE